MARLIKRFRNKPYPVTVGGETKYICGCGLSKTQPFCDGTHKVTQTENADDLCWYDDAAQRHTAGERYPDMRSDHQSKDA